jgi:hypothetical protein
VFSPCGKFRYKLWRRWAEGPTLAWCMLNPSTADAEHNDPTVRRCIERAKLLGYAGIFVVNIFAFRATLPSNMLSATDPVGPENDSAIMQVAADSEIVVCAWGSHGTFLDRGKAVLAMLPKEKLRHLGLTKHGQPGHPLYVPYSQPLLEFVT